MASRHKLVRHLRAPLAAALLAACASAMANSTVGAWSRWNDLPFFPVHAHMLYTGKVLLWPGDAGINGDASLLLDPTTQARTGVPQVGYDIFCSGHAFQADGGLFVAGGHISNNVGLARASIYTPATNSWTHVPDMNAGRWYPTVTTLASGDSLVVSGDVDTSVGVNTLPQVYQVASNSWQSLTTAQLQQPLYPMMFVMPDGRVIDVGPDENTRALDTSGTGQWSPIATRPSGWRDFGTAVMYADGKILFLGGGDPPSARAEVLDLNVPNPAWRAVAPMSVARRQLNSTVLPDGKVLVTGGTSGPGFNDQTSPVYTTELWDPATETWTTMASATVPRLYHSAATLLPDGTVLSTGGNGYVTPEVYSPTYLFKGTRPVISSAPANIAWGAHFTVQTSQAASIAKITLIRLTSVTHAFNENQRLNNLAFTRGTGMVDVTAPANRNLAPPGHYLLFIVDGNGVPSVGSVVQVSDIQSPPPPPIATQRLTVVKAGAEAARGSVTSTPAGIDCGKTCSANFSKGSTVTLTAKSTGRASFTGWSGACTGTGTCSVPMTADASVTATFVRR